MTALPAIHAVANPAGPIADEISGLWWLLLALGGACYLLVVALVVTALIRRPAEARSPQTNTAASTNWARPPVPERDARRWIVAGGVILPAVVLAVALIASVATLRRIPASAPPGSLSIEVTGHQWWWSVRYPELGLMRGQFTLTNEIHIPVGEPVQLTLSSVDVIHSFWVPELAGKIDVLPDYRTKLVIEADEPGEYRGRCAEFCGLRHAKMNILVIAHPPAEFKAWVEGQQRQTRTPPAAPETQ